MLQDDDFHRPNKRRVVARQIKSSSTWQLSSDILHQVLGFFLSARGVVDVEAIRSAMLVSKQWNEVVTSQSLWSIPQLHDEPFDSIRDALHIVDEGIVNNCREGEEMPSFIGFTKIEQMNCSFVDDSVVFRAVERSSRIPCLICVSPKDQVSDALLNHVFETHFFRGTFDFIAPFKNPRMTRKQFFLGIGQWGRRVIRWYVDGDIKSLTIPPVFCPQPSRIPLPLQEQELDSNEIISRKRMRLDYRHLQYLERSQTESLSDHLSRQSWALIVDWLIEITMCFSLDSRIPFHSMDLLRRFVSRMKVSEIPHKSMQFIPTPFSNFALVHREGSQEANINF